MAIVIVQARMSSMRLPGKVLLPLGEESSLSFMIRRIREASLVEEVWIATSSDASDDPIAEAATLSGTCLYRGGLNDVLSRFAGVSALTSPSDGVWVRLTADCPLVCPELIDETAQSLLRGNLEYVSNSVVRTFPRGLDVEAFTSTALREADACADTDFDREHVTTWMIRNLDTPKDFPRMEPPRPHLRVTVDYPEDYEVVRLVHENLRRESISFGCAEIVDFLEEFPEIAAINTHFNALQISDRHDPSL